MLRLLIPLALLAGAVPAHAPNRCEAPLRRGPVGLTETVYVKGTCGTLGLRPDGTIFRARPPEWAPTWAAGALARADARTYIAHPRRHLVLLRAGRTLWRSRSAHGSDDVALQGDAIAFTAYRKRHPNPDLWIASVDNPERLVARNEDLDGSARSGGFFTQRGQDLRLRATDGKLVRRLGLVSTTAYDRRNRTLVAITITHRVVRTDGEHNIVLADLRRLGLAVHPWLEVLPSGLIKICTAHRVLLLRPDGKRFAAAGLGRETAVSYFVTLSRLHAVAFVVQRRASGQRAFDRILLLEQGRDVPRLLYAAPASALQCGYWANLSTAGDDLLYWPSTGRGLVAIEASGRSGPRDLWPLVHRIPGFRGHGRILRAAWASGWNS